MWSRYLTYRDGASLSRPPPPLSHPIPQIHHHYHHSGVNDTPKDAQRLAELTQGLDCVVNLIEFNTHEGAVFKGSPRERVRYGVGVGVVCAFLYVRVRGAWHYCDTTLLRCNEAHLMHYFHNYKIDSGVPGDSQGPWAALDAKGEVRARMSTLWCGGSIYHGQLSIDPFGNAKSCYVIWRSDPSRSSPHTPIHLYTYTHAHIKPQQRRRGDGRMWPAGGLDHGS